MSENTAALIIPVGCLLFLCGLGFWGALKYQYTCTESRVIDGNAVCVTQTLITK
jgi:hypothetical protein